MGRGDPPPPHSGLSTSIGIMEKKMETAEVYWGYIGDILGYWKENGNYNSTPQALNRKP